MGTLEEALAEAVALSDETLIEPIDDILFVNPEQRTIEVPDNELLLGVYSDRNVERKHFKCPRIVGDNIDLSLCYIFVNYVSSSGVLGQVQSDDVEIDETGNYITFSWLLTGNVFDKNIDSKVYFSVQAKMPSGENVFNTRKAIGNVYETVEATEEITEEYADIILQIISRLDEIEQGGGITDEQIENALNKYLEENPISVPTKTSDLQNDSGFITKAVNDLENYYKKIETYNKEEVNNLVSLIPKFSIEIVSSLPTTDISNTTIYLVPSGDESANLYTEYIYANEAWEILGTQSVDLSGYALKTEIPKKLSDMQNDSGFISSPATATVGQVLEVEAIDESGKPTAWKTVTLEDGIANIKMTAEDTEVTIEPVPKCYIFPEMVSLTVSLTEGEEDSYYSFKFISGETATSLTINGVTLASSSDTVGANATYEVNIWDGVEIVKAVS